MAVSAQASIFLTFAVLALGAAGVMATPRGKPQTGAPDRETACSQRAFDGDDFTVCRFDATTQDFELAWKDAVGAPYRRLPALAREMGADASRVRFAVNAGMFDAAGAPIGLFVAAGRERHAINMRTASGNFYMKPNGVLWVDAASTVHVTASETYIASAPKPVWATQSGPMLVIGGALHPDIQPDGPSRNIRNGVCVLDDHTALFATSAGKVSFGKLARLFRDELHCSDALYLDGLVSSVWSPADKRMDDGHDLGPIIVVSDRK